MAVTVTVLGASGFGGAEVLRLLASHPGIEVISAGAGSSAGKRLGELYPSLRRFEDLMLQPLGAALEADADIVFSSLPHGESSQLFGAGQSMKVVDLAGDFRSADKGWVYGLTEAHRDEIAAATCVANPGCYATAALLVLGPLVRSGIIKTEGIDVTGMSGVSGAGRGGGDAGAFFDVNENVQPYRATGHAHIAEIETELSSAAGEDVRVGFVPHLLPMSRGLLVTCRAPAAEDIADEDAHAALAEAYRGEPFVRVLADSLPQTRRLTGTNLAEVAARTDPHTGTVIAFAAIDNLGKGAAGQALQNANLMLGFEETTALEPTGWVA